MNLNRLYLRRRDARRRTSKPQPRVSHERSLKAAGTIVPIIISIVALVISGLSYWNQRQSSEAAATAQQQSEVLQHESEARLVNPVWDYKAFTMTMQNLGTTEISNIDETFEVDIVNRNNTSPIDLRPVPLTILTIEIWSALPPCSSVITNEDSKSLQSDVKHAVYPTNPILSQFPDIPGKDKIYYEAIPINISFKDARGNTWIESPYGGELRLSNETEEHIYVDDDAILISDGAVKPNNCQ
jgi:hypothetical protein